MNNIIANYKEFKKICKGIEEKISNDMVFSERDIVEVYFEDNKLTIYIREYSEDGENTAMLIYKLDDELVITYVETHGYNLSELETRNDIMKLIIKEYKTC